MPQPGESRAVDQERLEDCPRCWSTAVNAVEGGYKFMVCRACGYRITQEAPEWTI